MQHGLLRSSVAQLKVNNHSQRFEGPCLYDSIALFGLLESLPTCLMGHVWLSMFIPKQNHQNYFFNISKWNSLSQQEKIIRNYLLLSFQSCLDVNIYWKKSSVIPSTCPLQHAIQGRGQLLFKETSWRLDWIFVNHMVWSRRTLYTHQCQCSPKVSAVIHPHPVNFTCFPKPLCICEGDSKISVHNRFRIN